MKLVVDANVLFSALIKDSGTRRLFFEERLEIYAPEYLFEEFAEHRDEIIQKAHRSEAEFWEVIGILQSKISIVPVSEFEKFMGRAQDVSPDKDDAVYFAVAFAIKGAIWSNDRNLKSRHAVRILNTSEIVAGAVQPTRAPAGLVRKQIKVTSL